MTTEVVLILTFVLFLLALVTLILFFFKKKESLSLEQSLNKEVESIRRQMEQVSSQLNERMKETSAAITATQAGVGTRVDSATKVITDVQSNIQKQMEQVSSQLNERMKETSAAITATQTGVGTRVDNATKVISEVQNKLGSLEAANKRIVDLAEGLKDLKDILKSPKLRGNMGEIFLEDLLRQVLPSNAYETQYRFLSGEKVDVIIRVGNNILSIDSKFPIEDFVRLLKMPDDQVEEKKKQRKKFNQGIILHAKSISQKYIQTDENTFDFAFMYIPAENIYYETIIKDSSDLEGSASLYAELLEKRVIPISPNTFYCYLQVIIRGLKGLKIEEDAKRILGMLGGVSNELEKFYTEYNKLGNHIKNTYNSFDGGLRRLDKTRSKFTGIEESLENKKMTGPM